MGHNKNVDFTFIVAGLIGLALWVGAYLWPPIAFIRDGLGRGESGNRMLLILIPGLTIVCLSVAVGEGLLAMDGTSRLRIVGLPVAGLGICLGVCICIWAFFTNAVPAWMRPKWLREEDRLGRSESLRRMRQRQAARIRPRKDSASLQLKPHYVAGLALGLPAQWQINTRPAPAAPLEGNPQVQVRSVLTADSPPQLKTRARFLVLRLSLPTSSAPSPTPSPTDAPAEDGASSALPAQTSAGSASASPAEATAGPSQPPVTSGPDGWQEWVKPLVVPTGWDGTEVGRTTIGDYPATWAISKRIAGPGMQQRWVVAAGPYLWVFALQVAGETLRPYQDLGAQLLRTVELPTAPPAPTESDE